MWCIINTLVHLRKPVTFPQVRSVPISQTPAEVADAIFTAYMSKQDEVLVGPAFGMAEAAFRLTKANISSLPILNNFL